MSHAKITEAELEHAEACHLVEADGQRWDVVDVTFEEGRAWVRARPPGDAEDGASPQIFETVVSQGGRLEWILPEGGRIRAVSGEGALLRWEREGDAANGNGRPARGGETTSRPFFQDAFLAY